MFKPILLALLALAIALPLRADGATKPDDYAWLDQGYTARWSRISAKSKARFRALPRETLQIRPLQLPVGDNLIEGNSTFSRPVICRVGDTLITCYMRRQFHWRLDGQARKNDDSSYSVITVSQDGGDTWSLPRSLSHELQGGAAADYATTGNGCVFYVLDEGQPSEEVVLVTSSGVYGTRDRGENWTLFEGALTPAQTPIGCNFSRQGLVHPTQGLVFFGHFPKRSEDLVTKLPEPAVLKPGSWIDRRMMVFQSLDRGRTWKQWAYDPGTEREAKFIEPTALLHDGGLFFLSRNMDTRTRLPIQAYSQSGWFPLDYVKVNDLNNPSLGQDRFPDTPDLIYNPVSKRIESVLCNRAGGPPGNPPAKIKSLLLYSIDPVAFRAGSTDWRFEGTLLVQENADGRADGMQPCGTTIDLEKGVQHIAVMLGDVNHTAGAYLVTRTLDTDRLRAQLNAFERGELQ